MTGEYISIDYRIENEAGERDRADIYVYFIDNPDVPVPVMDFIEMNTQSEVIVNLLENDTSVSDKDIIIYDVSSSGLSVEILDDQKSVRIISGEAPKISGFSYWIIEKDGNGLISKRCINQVNLYRNPDQPIAIIDSFYVIEGETILLDVLENDISNGELILVGDTLLQIIDNKIEYVSEFGSYGDIAIYSYSCQDISNNLFSDKQYFVVNTISHPNRPIAMNDTIYSDYSDTIYLNPLLNDINPIENDLLVESTMDTSILFNILGYVGSGWFGKLYKCVDTVSDMESAKKGSVSLRVYPEEPLEIRDIEIEMDIAETLEINFSEYTNIPDSIPFGIQSNWGIITVEDYVLTYQANLSNTAFGEKYFEEKEIYGDTIRINYNMPEMSHMHWQYIYISFNQKEITNYLDVGNYSIKVNPFGPTIANKGGKWGIDFPYMPSDWDDGFGYISTLGAFHPWLANYSYTEDIRLSGEQYQNVGEDFYPGPLVDFYNDEYLNKYFRTWKLNRYEIDEHRSHYQDAGYEINETILNWPAGKVTYNGVEYEQTDFQDLNENGIYEPYDGEYPIIYGDQVILYIINDARFKNWSEQFPNYTADSLNVDLYVMLYGFDRSEYKLMDQTFFVKYKVVNKSEMDYENFKFGLWTHFDPSGELYIGSSIGYDSTLDTYFSYPSSNNNITGQLLHSVTFLNKKMDKFTNTIVPLANPRQPYSVKYHFMSGTWHDTVPYNDPYWVDRTPLNYVYPSHPADPYGWSFRTDWVKSDKGVPGRQGLGTSGPHFLGKGESMEFEFAYHYNYENLGYIENIDQILENSRMLKECYQKDSVPGGGSFTGIRDISNNSNMPLLVYPNPAKTLLYVDGIEEDAEYFIYTLQGQKIEEGLLENEISIEHLSEGFYLLQIIIADGKQEWTAKFVKQ